MGYTQAQAKKLARQIFDRFDKRIFEACHGTAVPPRFVAGLIGNEAGKDRKGQIVEEATRFEPHVYKHLISVRDRGFRIASGKRISNYNGITQEQIADASDDAIRALSISYGATQIMGWHVINNLHCTIADLRNPDKHFFYTVKLLQLNGFPKNATKVQMDNEMRQWNTGREQGKTYHEDYVPNATLVRAEYSVLEEDRVTRTVEERFDGAAIETSEHLFDSTAVLSSDSQPTTDPAGSNSVEAPEPAGDPDTPANVPADTNAFTFKVEDWKGFIWKWLKRVWGYGTTANVTQATTFLSASVADPDRAPYYIGAGVLIFLLVASAVIIATIGLLVWLFINRGEIGKYWNAYLHAQVTPGVQPINLLFEKK